MIYFGHFISAVVFFQLLPLIPLWFEYMHTNTIEMDSYILCASMYCFTTGFSSKEEWMLGVCFLIALILTAMYKTEYSANTPVFPLNNSITLCLSVVFLMHFIERFRRHFIQREPFFLFNLKKEDKI